MKVPRLIIGLVLVAAGVLVILGTDAEYSIPVGAALSVVGIAFVAMGRKRPGA